MEKTDFEIFIECLNERMPGGKSNTYQKILFFILCVLGGLWFVSLLIWGLIGFAINIGLFLCVYLLFKLSYKEPMKLIINPTLFWSNKKFKLFKNES